MPGTKRLEEIVAQAKYGKPPSLKRVLSEKEIERVLEGDKLALLSLRVPCPCNLNCRYCYGATQGKGISFGQIKGVIGQAADLGAKCVSIVGEGEPLLYRDGKRDLFSLLDCINKAGAQAIVFTNGALVTPAIAKKLFVKDAVIVAKQNSLNPETQDYFSGTGAYEKISQGLSNLLEAGFAATNPSRLAIHTVICKQNYAEIPDMWVQWRKQNIVPYVQVLVPPAERNREFYRELYVKPEKVRELFHRLLGIDKKEFGFAWDADGTYPIAALGCSVVRAGCGITSTGDVQMCAYVEEPLGNIKEKRLKEILRQPHVQKIRKANYNPKGKNRFFYGCRALTLNMAGNRFAKDPFYWG
jgi:MoaA/NifB/PqqE/SkfB family radical SAM enzyme